jgi:hypothetical protein
LSRGSKQVEAMTVNATAKSLIFLATGPIASCV